MEEKDTGFYSRQRVRQTISIPYIWEERPGTPKKEWLSKAIDPFLSCPSPAKLVVSVPFQWEEMPGKPYPQSPPASPDPCHLALPQPISLCLPPKFAYSPSSSPLQPHCNQLKNYNPFIDDEDDDGTMPGLEGFAFDINPGLTPLLPQGLWGVQEKSNVNVLQESSSEASSKHHDNWYSVSETDSNNSSSRSGTQNSSIDASFLEYFFPLSSSDAGYLSKICNEGATAFAAAWPEHCSNDNFGGNPSRLVRRTLTLGELIMLSRKLSCKRKTEEEVKKQGLLMEFIRKNIFACFNSDRAAATVLSISAAAKASY